KGRLCCSMDAIPVGERLRRFGDGYGRKRRAFHQVVTVALEAEKFDPLADKPRLRGLQVHAHRGRRRGGLLRERRASEQEDRGGCKRTRMTDASSALVTGRAYGSARNSPAESCAAGADGFLRGPCICGPEAFCESSSPAAGTALLFVTA